MGWLAKRRERKALERAMEMIQNRILEHIEGGGSLDSLLTVVLFEAVGWDKSRGSWYVEVVAGGASWTEGSSVMDGEKLEKGQWVSLMSGRGGRREDAVVTSGRKISGGYRYYLDFEETGGASPWFGSLLVE